MAPAQTSTPARQVTVILEVAAHDFDIAWQQEYLYLKVMSDGTAECQTVKRKSGDMRFESADVDSVTRSLPQSELQRLKNLLARPDIARLEKTYSQRIAMMLDAGTVWDIQIPQTNRTQKIHVVAFAPDAAKARERPYPTGLLSLGCTIERLRRATIGKSSDSEADECRKALPAE